MFVLFISAFVVGLSGAMMPGSLLTYTIRKALSEGPRAGFIIVAGHALLELALVIVIFLGFDMVLQSKEAQVGIGLVGGALLAYMGFDMIRSSAKNRLAVQMDSDKTGSGSMIVYGVVLSATNPYFLLWWAIVGLGFIMQSYQTLGYMGAGIYYLGHIAADFGWYGLISIVVGKTRKFIKEKPYRVIIVVLGAMLIFFGIKFIFGAVRLIG
jgi:threonine/homoserine/homoserine lactone efflux protein